jgi:hypothetical protein
VSAEKTIQERGNVHGEFSENAEIADRLEAVARDGKNWHSMGAVKRVALTYIFGKISRIVCGDPNHADHWHDIQGYAKCVEDRLTPPKKDITALYNYQCPHCRDGIPVEPVAGNTCPLCKTNFTSPETLERPVDGWDYDRKRL